jgi:hypothetical protein
MRSETLLVTPLADHLIEHAGDRQGTIARQKLASDARAIRFIRINSSGPVCDSWRNRMGLSSAEPTFRRTGAMPHFKNWAVMLRVVESRTELSHDLAMGS